ELKGDLLGLVRGLLDRDGPPEDLIRRVVHRVLQPPSFDAPAPEVLVDTPRLLLDDRDRDLVLLCVLDLPFAGEVQLTDRGDYLEAGYPEDEVEPELVVPLAGASVGYSPCLLPEGDPDHFLGDQGPRECSTHRVSLVGPVRPDSREEILGDEPIP